MSSQKLEHFVLFDSDGNAVSSHLADEGECTVRWLGEAVLAHTKLCEQTSRDNADFGIEPAYDPLTLLREWLGPDSEWYRGPRPAGDDD